MMEKGCTLQMSAIEVNYGSIRALRGIDLTVSEGEIVTLIGANGAGKTTTMHTVMGLLKPAKGSVIYQGQEITRLSTRERVKRGIVISPEGRQIFPRLSTEDNLYTGGMDYPKPVRARHMKSVYDLFPILYERRGQIAGTLSGGEQQMLAVGRALMGDPKLLLMDEPSLGLAPLLVQTIFDLIARIRDEHGISILLVEQNARMALRVSDRAYVLENGRIAHSGPSAELAHSDAIRKAYLGG